MTGRPRATVQDIREALRDVLDDYSVVDNTPALRHAKIVGLETVIDGMAGQIAELIRNVEDRTDERDQALTRIDGLNNTITRLADETDQRDEVRRDYDSLRVEWDQVTVERDQAWAIIARMTLDWNEHAPTSSQLPVTPKVVVDAPTSPMTGTLELVVMPCSKCARYDHHACDNAAVDRRSL